MSPKRLWLIDGHNVIFAVPSLHALQVTERREEARDALVDTIERFAQARGENVVIVFDGKRLASNPDAARGLGSHRDAARGPLVEVVYAPQGEGRADERIVYEATRCAEQRRPVSVVTNDVQTLANRLPRRVDHLGVAEFWTKHVEKRPRSRAKPISGDFGDIESELLEYSAAEEISAAKHASAGRASLTGRDPADSPGDARAARPSGALTDRDRLRLKRERGRLRQQRRLQRQRKAKRRV